MNNKWKIVNNNLELDLRSFVGMLETAAVSLTAAPLLVGTVRFRRCDYGLRAIVILIIISLITDALTAIYEGEGWLSLYHVRLYTFLEFVAYTLFFYSISTSAPFKKLMLVMLLPFLGVCIADLHLLGVKSRDDLATTTEGTILILYSIITLYLILKETIYPNILRTPQFWIISATLIYFAGNIFVFAFYNYGDRDARQILWGLHSVISMLFYSLIAIGLWKTKESH